MGGYTFATNVDELADGGQVPDSIGGGLQVDSAMVIRLDNPADYRTGPIGTLDLMATSATTAPTTDFDDAIDSDGVLGDGTTYGVDKFPEIQLRAVAPGMNTHSLDFAFGVTPTPPTTTTTTTTTTAPTPTTSTTSTPADSSVAGHVFVDLDQDSVFDTGEPTLPGVAVALTSDRAPTAALRASFELRAQRPMTITDSNGVYRFAGVPAGAATIEVVVTNGDRPIDRVRSVIVRGQTDEDFPVTRLEANQLSGGTLPVTGSAPGRLVILALVFAGLGVLLIVLAKRQPGISTR